MPSDAFNDSEPVQNKKQATLAIEVVIQTSDYEIEGLIHVSRQTRQERRLTELLNDPDKRFLAVTDARLTSKHTAGGPRLYRFLQLRLNDIQMIHPAIQAVSLGSQYSNEEKNRFHNLRSKVSSPSTETESSVTFQQ
jgi:hypothetical protein